MKASFIFVTKNNELDTYSIRFMDKFFNTVQTLRIYTKSDLKRILTEEELEAIELIESLESKSRTNRKEIKELYPTLIRFSKRKKHSKYVFSRDNGIRADNFRYTVSSEMIPNI